MEKGTKIDLFKIAKTCRPMDANTTLSQVQASAGKMVFWSWGVQAIKAFTNEGEHVAVRFKVSGHHHKGHVYIILNFNDLYNIYFTTTKGTIVDVAEDIFCEDLGDVIDRRVEKIPEYQY